MDQEKEDKVFVFYAFESSDFKIDERDDPTWGKINILETRTGFCKFNKHDESFELDAKRSDPYYLQKPEPHEVIMVMAKLIKQKRAGLEFPDKLDIATG